MALPKGNIPWNKGLKTGIVPKTAFKKGSPAPITAFKPGHIPWHAGKKGLVLNTGRTWFGKGQEPKRGIESNFWKGGIAGETQHNRAYFYFTVRKKVLERDQYKCKMCGTSETRMHVDHIKQWAKFPELRFEEGNCRTLCRNCHKQVTFASRKEEYA